MESLCEIVKEDCGTPSAVRLDLGRHREILLNQMQQVPVKASNASISERNSRFLPGIVAWNSLHLRSTGGALQIIGNHFPPVPGTVGLAGPDGQLVPDVFRR